MREVIGYIRKYARETNKPVLISCTLFVAVLVWLNYSIQLERQMITNDSIPFPTVIGRYLIFLCAFVFPYLLIVFSGKKLGRPKAAFPIYVLVAPLIFAAKAGADTWTNLSSNYDWNEYWNAVFYWPVRLLVMAMAVLAIGKLVGMNRFSYGLTAKNVKWKPYWLMLVLMIPLIVAASSQPDFLATYPKMKNILPLPTDANPAWWYQFLFELSYGSDFFSIEFFFRGFLVIGFAKWVGKDAILPMACFYCTIHFGKPLGECISSYFGGLLLGIVSFHTRSIYGGLMVHLGIAWLMEAGGYIGNRMMHG
jgi:hypothetical protein